MVNTAPLNGISAHQAAGVSQSVANKNPYELASSLLGKGEVPDRGLITEYLKSGGVNLDPATTAWCAAYVNSTLAQTGFKGTGSNLARSFTNYGEPVDTPAKGDIAVFSRGNNPSLGHVGFFDSLNPDGSIKILAGNQGNAVSYGSLPADRLIGYRRPIPADGSAAPTMANMQNKTFDPVSDVMNSARGAFGMAPMAQPQPPQQAPAASPMPPGQPIPAAVAAAAAPVSRTQNLFGQLALLQANQPQEAPQIAPIRGPSAEQANALATFLASLKSRPV